MIYKIYTTDITDKKVQNKSIHILILKIYEQKNMVRGIYQNFNNSYFLVVLL